MNALDLLKADHSAVEALFQQAEKAPGSAAEGVFVKIKSELEAHAYIEESIFYPAIQEAGDKELIEITSEALQEHSQMKATLGELTVAEPDDFEAMLVNLIKDVRHHVKEEEGEMFPLVEAQFTSNDLEIVGLQMKAEKERFSLSTETIHS